MQAGRRASEGDPPHAMPRAALASMGGGIGVVAKRRKQKRGGVGRRKEREKRGPCLGNRHVNCANRATPTLRLVLFTGVL